MSAVTDIKVNIRNVAVGGAGVGEVIEQQDGGSELLGITAFVPFAARGEVISARVVERKPRYVKAELLSVENSSLERVEPPCRFFQTCGGCELQHVRYQEQLIAKRAMIEGAFRAAKLGSEVIDKLESFKPGQEYAYRRRVKLHVDPNGKIGFYRAQSRSVVKIDRCEVAVEEISEALQGLSELGSVLSGKVSSIVLEVDESGLVAVLHAPYAVSEVEAKSIIDSTKKVLPNLSLYAAGKNMGGVGRSILELPLDKKSKLALRVPAGSFSQVNWQVNLDLIEYVVEESSAGASAEVIDLYSGAGNFSLPLAATGARVTAVESDATLVRFARENSERNNLASNVNVIQRSVEAFLKNNPLANDAIVIADPPRNGLGPLASGIGGKRLILVSCHLPSFVRDVKKLIERDWWLSSMKPFDMFAQTSYVELVGVFER